MQVLNFNNWQDQEAKQVLATSSRSYKALELLDSYNAARSAAILHT